MLSPSSISIILGYPSWESLQFYPVSCIMCFLSLSLILSLSLFFYIVNNHWSYPRCHFLMLFIPSCIFVFLSGPISFCMKNTLQNSSDACLLLVNAFGFLLILKTSLPLFCIDNQQQCFIFKFSCEHLLTSTWLFSGVICLDLFGPAWVILLCHIQPSGSPKMGTSASFHHSHPHSPFFTGLPCSTWRVSLLIF